MKTSVYKILLKLFSSRRLTVFLMIYAVILIFIATLSQKDLGIIKVQEIYFESFFCLGEFLGIKVPLIGGASLGILALLNILCSGLRYTQSSILGLGQSITHISLALLIISGALQYFMREQGQIVLHEGSQTNIISITRGEEKEIKTLPFDVGLVDFKHEYWQDSNIPKSYSSNIYFKRGEVKVDKVVAMNAPVSFSGWTFYQMSYANEGRTSILAVVKNPAKFLPWLSVGGTFFGIILIFFIKYINARRHR